MVVIARDGGYREGGRDARYSVHKLFDLEDEHLGYYLAALTMLQHADAPRAREILEIRDRDELIVRAEGVAEKMRGLLERGARAS